MPYFATYILLLLKVSNFVLPKYIWCALENLVLLSLYIATLNDVESLLNSVELSLEFVGPIDRT
jgi:hypothetical protein